MVRSPLSLSAARMIVLGALVLLLCLAGNARAESVACSEIDLSFDTSDGEPYCHAGKESGRNAGSDTAHGWATRWEAVGLDTAERSIVLQREVANNRSYFEKLDVRSDVDGEPWFTGTRGWGEVYHLDGYEVQEFERTWNGISGYWACAAFSRYDRTVALGGAGYSDKLRGAYCVPPGGTVGADMLTPFFDSIKY